MESLYFQVCQIDKEEREEHQMNTFITYNKLTGVSIRNTGLCVGEDIEDIEDIIFAVHYEQEGELTCILDLQQALYFLSDGEAMEKLGITDDMQDAVELVYNIIQEILEYK